MTNDCYHEPYKYTFNVLRNNVYNTSKEEQINLLFETKNK